MQAASQRVCESASCKSASMRVASASLRVESLRVTSFERKNYLRKLLATHIYHRVKYWHVASLGIKLSKAGNNKGADIRTFFSACHKLGFIMTWLRLIK